MTLLAGNPPNTNEKRAMAFDHGFGISLQQLIFRDVNYRAIKDLLSYSSVFHSFLTFNFS